MPPNVSHLSRNTLALLTSNLGSILLSFLLSVLIGRVLGQNGLGVYAAALAWVYPLSQLAEFGLGTLITRDLAQQQVVSWWGMITGIGAISNQPE